MQLIKVWTLAQGSLTLTGMHSFEHTTETLQYLRAACRLNTKVPRVGDLLHVSRATPGHTRLRSNNISNSCQLGTVQ